MQYVTFDEASPALLFPILMLLERFLLAEAFFDERVFATLDKGSSSEKSPVKTTQGIQSYRHRNTSSFEI